MLVPLLVPLPPRISRESISNTTAREWSVEGTPYHTPQASPWQRIIGPRKAWKLDLHVLSPGSHCEATRGLC
ncbi:hypothetical protein E2C01_092040 [Portunus trituberculatus]|uniref:Uncharacterized protein n=1 Tax=Portunus trituberculatus TaxID=210409 RepID=A0A5B7JWP8_PORTR|nr:hypothetical protein [Portunus trituberculatus]